MAPRLCCVRRTGSTAPIEWAKRANQLRNRLNERAAHECGTVTNSQTLDYVPFVSVQGTPKSIEDLAASVLKTASAFLCPVLHPARDMSSVARAIGTPWRGLGWPGCLEFPGRPPRLLTNKPKAIREGVRT